MTLGREFKALNGKNDSGLGIRRTTLGRELRALIERMTLGHR